MCLFCLLLRWHACEVPALPCTPFSAPAVAAHLHARGNTQPLACVYAVCSLKELVLDGLVVRLHAAAGVKDLGRLTNVGHRGYVRALLLLLPPLLLHIVCSLGPHHNCEALAGGHWLFFLFAPAASDSRWAWLCQWAAERPTACLCATCIWGVGGGPSSAPYPLCPALHTLPLLGAAAPLQLESLAVNATARNGLYLDGLDTIPSSWRQLSRLSSLELRCELPALHVWTCLLACLALWGAGRGLGLGQAEQRAGASSLCVTPLRTLGMYNQQTPT